MADTPVSGGGNTLTAAAKAMEGLLFPTEAPEADPTPPATPGLQDTDSPPAPEDATEPADAPPAPAEETDEAEPTPEPARARKLRMPDGTEAEVTEDEAYLGYLRQADYTRKTQLAAEERKAAAAERQQARDARAQYAAHLDAMKTAMDAMVPKEPDWGSLRARLTPEQYADALTQWDTFKKNRATLEAERVRVAKETVDDTRAELERVIADEEEKLYNAIPEWRDAAKREPEQKALLEWLRGKGWDDDRIGQIVDHRLIVSFRDAMRWEQLQAKKPAARAARPPIRTVAPGTTPPAPRKPADAADQARAKLAKSGKIDDAASYFLHTLKD